jgi:hypothetical protein
MKRKTKNVCLLEVVKRQEREIASLHGQIAKHEERERIRDDAWNRHTSASIKNINTVIRTAKNFDDYVEKMKGIGL